MVLAKYDNELLLVWKDPETRNRFVIGRLWKEDAYYFEYIRQNEGERGSVDLALKFGYTPFKMFCDLEKTYHSDYLFTPFLNRLPVKKRKDNPFGLLRKTGGKLNTDNLEFMLPIDIQKEKRNVIFNVVGWRYYDGEKALKNLEIGQKLLLKIEKDNLYDPHDIEIWAGNCDYKLGYVPAVYSRYIDKLVAEDNYEAIVKDINLCGSSNDILKVKFAGVMIKANTNEIDDLVFNI